MSPDAKAEQRISNQSLAVLFEETEDTYETLSSKYDDVTFSDVKNDVRGSVPDVSKMVAADEPDFVHAVVETAPAKVECEVMPSHVRECVKSTKTAPITSPDVPTSAVATPAQSTLTSTQAALTTPAQSTLTTTAQTAETTPVQAALTTPVQAPLITTVQAALTTLAPEVVYEEEITPKPPVYLLNIKPAIVEGKIINDQLKPVQHAQKEVPIRVAKIEKRDPPDTFQPLAKPVADDLKRIQNWSDMYRRDYLLLSTGLSENLSLTLKPSATNKAPEIAPGFLEYSDPIPEQLQPDQTELVSEMKQDWVDLDER